MNGWLIPLCTAFSSWFGCWLLSRLLFFPVIPKKIAGWKIQGYLPKYKQQWVLEATELLVNEIANDKRLQHHFASPATLAPLLPTIESHIDEFLRFKLGKAMPVVGMFVGDRTINQMKGIFMEELKILFPVIMQQFLQASTMPSTLRPVLLTELHRIANAPGFDLLLRQLKKKLHSFCLVAGVLGLITGLMLWLLLVSFNMI